MISRLKPDDQGMSKSTFELPQPKSSAGLFGLDAPGGGAGSDHLGPLSRFISYLTL